MNQRRKMRTKVLSFILCAGLMLTDVMPAGAVQVLADELASGAEAVSGNAAEENEEPDEGAAVPGETVNEDTEPAPAEPEKTPEESEPKADEPQTEAGGGQPEEPNAEEPKADESQAEEPKESEPKEEEPAAEEIEVGEGGLEAQDVEEAALEDDGSVKSATGDSSTVVDNNNWKIEKGTLTIKAGFNPESPEAYEWRNWEYNSKYDKVVIAGGNTKLKDLSNMFSNCTNIESVTIGNLSSVTNMNSMFANCTGLKTVSFTGAVSGVKEMKAMFSGCSNLNEIKISGNFNTSQVTDMSSLFSGCSSLNNWTFLSKFTTFSKVENMSSMFANCGSLESLGSINSLKTGSVTNMSSMFSGCSSLTDLDELKNFDTSNVTDMSSMFRGCSRLTQLDLSSFNTESVTDMSSMFSGCNGLLNITFGGKFNTGSVTNMSSMFANCGKLGGTEALDLSNFSTDSAKDMSSMFSGCGKLSELNLSGFKTDQVTDMSSMFARCESLSSLDLSSFNTGNVTNMSSMFSGCRGLAELNISSFDTGNVGVGSNNYNKKSMASMFSGCELLENLDLSHFNTGNVPDMSSMFSGCKKLKNTELISNFNTNKVEKTTSMFSGCTGLESAEFVSSFSAASLQDMSSMFSGCAALASVVFQNDFASETLTNMSSMFLGCKSLTHVEFQNGFNAGKLQNVNSMFKNCSALESMDEANFFGSCDLMNMGSMFAGCESLTEVKFDADFHSEYVTDMSSMFSGCTSLVSLDVTSLDTGWVTNMNSMFQDCSSLTSLDVSTFNTGKVSSMNFMFSGCTRLETLNLSHMDTSSTYNLSSMFYNCKSLTSLDMSSFDLSRIRNSPFSISNFLLGCDSLVLIRTPKYLATAGVTLPGTGSEMWYRSDGKDPDGITCLPTDEVSKVIGYGSKPVGGDPWILLTLEKAEYEYGAILDEKQLRENMTVIYSNEWGNSYEITDYTTNFKEIDTETPGPKDLIVTYGNTEAKAEIRFVRLLKEEETIITMPDDEIRYSGNPKQIYPIAVTMGDRKLELEKDYTVAYEDNVNAGTAKMLIKGIGGYGGTITKEFAILKRALTKEEREEDFADQVDRIGSCNRPRAERTLDISGHFKDIKEKTFEIADYKESVYNEGEVLAGAPTLEGGILTYDTNAGVAGDKAEITIKTSFDNYEDVTFRIIVEFTSDVDEDDDIIEDADMYIGRITNQIYTGSELKPRVYVYTYLDGKGVYLKEGTDYTVRYANNIAADTVAAEGGFSSTGDEGDRGFTKNLPYVTVTGKGNYSGTLYRNFHINPRAIASARGNAADGFTLKYTDQIIVSTRKAQKTFTSLKYKKILKDGVDYDVSLTAFQAYAGDGASLAKDTVIGTGSGGVVIPAGYSGVFHLSVTGKGNYKGEIVQTVYVADKEHMIKNATISIGKNQKSRKYTGEEITLASARYDAATKRYYNAVDQQVHKDDVFTVKCGNAYLIEGRDYDVSYSDNVAVGKACITITGKGDYCGKKNGVFQIAGKKFSAYTVNVEGLTDMIYTGRPCRQSDVTLYSDTGMLESPKDYSISYANNTNKGNATIIFTANPRSGYTGSFKKRFKIKEGIISKDTVTVLPRGSYVIEDGLLKNISYRIGGAEPSGCVSLVNKATGLMLREGTDYTVSYKNNMEITDDAAMFFKGKGNYSGSTWINFEIVKTDITTDDEIVLDVGAAAFNAMKPDDYEYQPKIRILDNGKALRLEKDFDVEYFNNTQGSVTKYMYHMENEIPTEETYKNRPYAVITTREESGYVGTITVDLTIYKNKLTAKTVYVVLSGDKEAFTYDGKPVKPEMTLYFGSAKAVRRARTEMQTDENLLTAPEEKGGYGLKKLELRKSGIDDYTYYYGDNVTAGVGKGCIYISGKGLYYGDIKQTFTIYSREI